MTQVPSYDPAVVEARWQERWARDRTNEPELDQPRRPFYNLMMFPYPSAEGLHVGNMFAFTGADIYGSFKRLQGPRVFEPIGFDAFGIHSENYALSVGTHPAKLIPQNIETFRRQLRRFGGMLDWAHELSTTDPRYYKWTQWIFLQLFKAGVAFRKKAAVNWCPKDMSVVANEQVINGFCERHPDTKVEQRFLEQWFFNITRYAERLLKNLDQLDWSDSTRTLQRNWIGRSEGAELIFETPAGAKIPVFTTRPDTVFGATYLVLAPEHPLVDQLTADEQRRDVNAYRRAMQGRDIVSRRVGDKTKSGVFLGSYARNPATGEAIPIWIADYVLREYGTGAIMAVPAHDTRDFEFATQFKLPIREVVRTGEPLPSVTQDGTLVNSGEFSGLSCRDGQRRIVAWLQQRGLATSQVQYRLHDWCISRQRYWGPPIPIIYCDSCGPVAVPERDLPVELPFIQDFRPDASGVSPLARHKEWYFVKCPQCGASAAPPGGPPFPRRPPPGGGGGLAARAPQGVVLREVPAVRRPGPARDRRVRHVPRLGVVLPALPVDRIRRPAVGPGAHPGVAAGAELHRRQRARRVAPALFPLHHDGAARAREAAVRRAVPEAPRAWADHQGWREDVQVARQRGHSRRLHPEVGRRHAAPVPDVPGAVPGGRRLPRHQHHRGTALSR